MNKTILSLDKIKKNFYTVSGEITAIRDISFDVKEDEFIVIVGSSGCGKSTLLNIIAGLDEQTSGRINKDKDLKIGYMLQEDALLPFMNVYENALLGLKLQKKDTKESRKYVDNLLEKYGLAKFKQKYPNELSGGMKQRVALIRTLATNPDLLLLDEPFSALDYQSRLKVADDVYRIIKSENKTAIMITHDLGEAISIATKIVVLSKRPSSIKKIYTNIFEKELTPLKKRQTKKFTEIYDILWRDLDESI